MKSIIPILVVGGGILFLFSNKKTTIYNGVVNTSKPDPFIEEESIPTFLKGISQLTCHSIKIKDKKEFNNSIKDLALQVIKNSPKEKDHKVCILDIFELAAPICYEKLNANSTENERITFALLLSEIIKVYRLVIIPNIKEEKDVWEGAKIEALRYSFLKQLNITQEKFDQVNNKFQKILQFPLPYV